MNRRQFAQFGFTLPLLSISCSALAHHGWSSFDDTRPLYFEGKVKSSKWQNPHAEVVIDMSAAAALPADLAKRAWPKQTQAVDSGKIIAATSLPKARGDWTLELSPLTRIEAWKVAQPKAGDIVAAIGFTFKDEKKHDGVHMARIEYFIVGDKIYGLRSMPVQS
jgi:hypothetical protein